MSAFAIEVNDLRKVFDGTIAVDGISFAVEKGTITALLGGNGAGKTTTLAILLGLTLPTSGSIRILGHDMIKDRFAALPRMNFSSPYVDLPNRLTVLQNLRVFAHLYGIRDIERRIAELAEHLQFKSLLHRTTGELSAGQKTRVSLAKSLLNKPDVLLLDEPTASLDPDTADWVRGYLEEYNHSTGATILLASHNMNEVERLADHVIIMREGQIITRGDLQHLFVTYSRTTLEEVFLDIARNRNAV